MTLDWNHFTPCASLGGGVLIGVAATMLALLNGCIAGISGIVGGLLARRRGETPSSRGFRSRRSWRRSSESP